MARAIAEAVDLPLGWDIGWQRQEVDRLLDADHSALAARVADRLRRWGWEIHAEASYNRYGDRGRIDLLAYRRSHETLVVVEVKTMIVDLQALLGGLDVKARVAPDVARSLGWTPRRVVPAIVVADGSTVRRRLADFDALLARYACRGHAALAWLREPAVAVPGLLVVTKTPPPGRNSARRAGRRRVRVPHRLPPSAGR
jgi:hypothetical protein